MVNGVRRTDPVNEYFTAENCHILELSNSADDAAVSIARARVAVGATTRWHRLHGIAERYVILAGRGSVEVGDTAAEIVVPGDVVHIPAETRQRIHNVGAEELIFLAICTPRFVQQAYEDLG